MFFSNNVQYQEDSDWFFLCMFGTVRDCYQHAICMLRVQHLVVQPHVQLKFLTIEVMLLYYYHKS